MKVKRYSDEEFVDAVKNSSSIRSVLIKIGLKPIGGNYAVAKRRIKLMGLNTEYFTGQGYLKGKTHQWAKKIPTEEILIKESKYGGSSSKLKKRLFQEKLLEEKCYECGISE